MPKVTLVFAMTLVSVISGHVTSRVILPTYQVYFTSFFELTLLIRKQRGARHTSVTLSEACCSSHTSKMALGYDSFVAVDKLTLNR